MYYSLVRIMTMGRIIFCAVLPFVRPLLQGENSKRESGILMHITSLPDLRLIAEDLGFLTPQVLQLRDESGLPGMKVLEFAFDSPEPSPYLPHTYIQNTVCYTGTHDNMTLTQWLEEGA